MANQKEKNKVNKLIDSITVTNQKKKDDVVLEGHEAIVDKALNFRIANAQSSAIQKGIEEGLIELAKAKYGELKGAASSIGVKGSAASLKVVFKASFSKIDFEKHSEIMNAITEWVGEDGEAEAAFEELFEVNTSIALSNDSPDQISFLDLAMKLAGLIADGEAGSEELEAAQKKFGKFLRGKATADFSQAFLATKSISVRPIVAQIQHELPESIRGFLKQVSPSISVAPKEIQKVSARAAIDAVTSELGASEA
jgi:hypothetical protein